MLILVSVYVICQYDRDMSPRQSNGVCLAIDLFLLEGPCPILAHALWIQPYLLRQHLRYDIWSHVPSK
jgi:hypothetical protein